MHYNLHQRLFFKMPALKDEKVTVMPIYFGIPQDIDVCRVCALHVNDLALAYFARGMPK
jgi:hypothetical protein